MGGCGHVGRCCGQRRRDGVALLRRVGVIWHLAVVKSLVGAGADVNATDNSWPEFGLEEFLVGALILPAMPFIIAESTSKRTGRTALHWAAREGHWVVVKYLVGAGADLEATSNDRWTALHFAARWGHLAVVKYLVGHGLSVTAMDNNGKTPRDLAVKQGHTAVVNYLDSLFGLRRHY